MSKWIRTIMVLLIFESSCTNSKLDLPDYMNWIKNNPIKASATDSDFAFHCTYKPGDLMAINELRESINDLSKDSLQALLNNYSQGTYLSLAFASKDGDQAFLRHQIKSEEEYYERINYLTTEVPYDVYLIQNQDTFPTANHLYERAYSMRLDETVLLYFDTPKQEKESFTLFYTGKFSSKPLMFEFNNTILESIPNLSL
jgi:hypothetical protein